MARIEKIICDACGKEKQQSNHWYGMIANFDAAHDDWKMYAIAVCPADTVSAVTDKDWRQIADVCGQACAIDCVSRFLSTGRIERTSAAVAADVPKPWTPTPDESCPF